MVVTRRRRLQESIEATDMPNKTIEVDGTSNLDPIRKESVQFDCSSSCEAPLLGSNDADIDSDTELSVSVASSMTPDVVASSMIDSDDEGDAHTAPATMSTIGHETDGFETDTMKSFVKLRCSYLVVMLVIMLADGLQGTHLYVLYESYGYSVASLYCLGFLAGGLASPITGPLIDKIGRQKAALLYCALEIFINRLEQYPWLFGLIVSRVIGGFTTNLLSSVFEAWLDTEYRRRGLNKDKYEIIMRDSVIISNLAAIFSGYLAHVLAEHYGAVGPFHGAVTCTAIALAVVLFVWNENYGNGEHEEPRDMSSFLSDAMRAFQADSKMLRVAVIQGLSTGSIHIFIFLWAPFLRELAVHALKDTVGLDSAGDPAYGLIFGAFMLAGVLGGLAAPLIRSRLSTLLAPIPGNECEFVTEIEGEGKVSVRPMAVELLAASCYVISAACFAVPILLAGETSSAFLLALAAFVAYEFLIGVFMPCEGVIRSLYFPANGRGSVMVLPRIIVNVVVSVGVYSTNHISFPSAAMGVACLLFISACLQLSLISVRDWKSLARRSRSSFALVRQLYSRTVDALRSPVTSTKKMLRRTSSTLLPGLDLADDSSMESETPRVPRLTAR